LSLERVEWRGEEVRVSRRKGGALGAKGASFLEELSWRAHLLERRRAHGMEMGVGLRLGALLE
jgi:hypothetical protein